MLSDAIQRVRTSAPPSLLLAHAIRVAQVISSARDAARARRPGSSPGRSRAAVLDDDLACTTGHYECKRSSSDVIAEQPAADNERGSPRLGSFDRVVRPLLEPREVR